MIQKVQPQVDFLAVIRDLLPQDGFFVPELSKMGLRVLLRVPVLAPRTYGTEGYWGTLGLRVSARVRREGGNPTKAVVSVTGDGGFLFGLQELATAAAHGIGVVTIVFNNLAHGTCDAIS